MGLSSLFCKISHVMPCGRQDCQGSQAQLIHHHGDETNSWASFPQMSRRRPSWRTRMKTPSHPAPQPPSPPRNRAQAPVTPALTLSHLPSAPASRICPMSGPTPLPSTATARWMMRRCWASSPASRHSKGSQDSDGTPYVSEVAADNQPCF